MIITKNFKAKGMHCQSCETLIDRAVKSIDGVKEAISNYETETVRVTFDSDKITLNKIKKAVEEKGYDCDLVETHNNIKSSKESKKDSEHLVIDAKFAKFFGLAFGIIGAVLIGYYIYTLSGSIALPEISANMSYGLLFLVGLLTGFHCVSMCGGFVVSYTTKHAQEGTKAYGSHLMYGLGKTLSYTIIGAAFGLLGSIIIFTPFMRGAAGIIAGGFLIIFGLNMLNIIPGLRKIRIRTPAFMARFVGTESKKHKSPLVIGLLNGLMLACGPLQAIYIMAASTGSPLEGAKLLFVFGLGTLPVMLSFGFFTSFLSSKATHKILKASGLIVIILGAVMLNRGLALTGSGLDATSLLTSTSGEGITGNVAAMEGDYQVIRMEVNRYGWEPDKFVLQKDVPVKWIINGLEINGCNNAIQVPKFGLEFDIKQGEQTIEFTPDKEGVISWSCWMGMIPGVFIVKDDIDLNNAAAVQDELAAVPELKGGSCGGGSGGGGCGCGGGR